MVFHLGTSGNIQKHTNHINTEYKNVTKELIYYSGSN